MIEPAYHLLELAAKRPLTVADLPAEDPYGRMELIDGSLFVTPGADIEHQALVTDITLQLHGMCPPDSGLRVFAGINVISRPGTLVIPDVAVAVTGAKGLGFEPGQLALVVEVTSPSTRRRDLTIKRDLYLEWDIPLILVDRTRMPVITVHGDLPEWVGELTI